MKKLHLFKTILLLCALIVGSNCVWAADPVTLVSGSGTSDYAVPTGWTTSGTVDGGSYLKLDNGTITSPAFAPHNSLSFAYTVATFGSGTNHPLTIRILNASTDAVIVEKTTATPTSSTYIDTDSPISLGDVGVNFKIQLYAPSGKGIRLRNYSVTGTPASSDPAISLSGSSLAFGEVGVGKTKNMIFTVTPANLTSELSISCDNTKYSVSPTSISKDASGAQTVTVSATPTSLSDNMSGTITISGGGLASDETVTLSTTVVRNNPNFAFDNTSVTITKGDAFTAPIFSKDDGVDYAEIIFTSSYSDVATVSNTGVIALGGSTGTAIIKASLAQNDVYTAGEASCTITVNPAGVAQEPSATGYYEKVTSTAGVTAGKYLIVYETDGVAFDGSLASLDGSNNTINVEISKSKITATDEINESSFTLAVYDGGFSIQSASGKFIGRSDASNGMDTGDSEMKNTIEISEGNAIIAGTGGYQLRFNSASGTGNYRFRYYASGKQKDVQLYKFVAPVPPANIDIYVSAAAYATYASNFNLDFTSVEGLKAFIAKEVADEVKLTQVNKVPSGTGILLHATDGGDKKYTVPVSDTTDDMTGNKFVRGTGAAVATGDGPYNYILNVVDNKIGFYKAAGNTVATNRAYLQTSVAASGRIALVFDDDETTSINTIANSTETENRYFNLAGQRVVNPTNGLYIVNGKKVVIK